MPIVIDKLIQRERERESLGQCGTYLSKLLPSPLPFSLSYPDFGLSVCLRMEIHSDYSLSKVVIMHISFLSPLKTLSLLDFAGWRNHPGEVEVPSQI